MRALHEVKTNEKMLMTEHRCWNCNKKICHARVYDGVIEIKCKCGSLNYITGNNNRTDNADEKK